MPFIQSSMLSISHSIKFILSVCVIFLCSYAEAQITSPFTSNAEGWTTPNDADATISYSATGGNPGGMVFGNPFVIPLGAGNFYVPFYFVAPATYIGNRSSYYNGTLRYDIQQSTTGTPNQYAEVTIADNGGVTLYYFPTTPNQPPAAPAWTRYSVVFNNALGFWKTTNSATGLAAGETQIQSVLASLASLQIRGLYRDANTTNRLDNVTFTPPIIINTQPPASTSACVGTSAILTTAASGNPSITYQWQRIISGVYVNISNTGNYSGVTTNTLTINTNDGTATGNYRCAISGTNVENAYTNNASVSINTLPNAPTTTGASSCSPSALTLSASGLINGQYRWYNAAVGGTVLSTTNTYLTPVLSLTTTYYVVIFDGACESSRTPVTATINTPPAAPTSTGSARCGTGTVTLAAAGGSAGQYRWYTVPTAGVAIAGQTNSGYTTPVITGTTTYYVSINNGTCESTRTPVIAAINTPPAAPTTTGGSGCPPISITLNAAGGSAGQYRWYTAPTGGTAITGETNSTYTTPALTSTTTYHVSVNNGTCESTRTAVVATILTTGCNTIPPTIDPVPLTTIVAGKIILDLVPLIVAPGVLDINSITIVTPPSSGASASVGNGILTIDYGGKVFSGNEFITIRACDVAGLCSQPQTFTIEVAGDIIVYNAISPNNDKRNEILYIKYIDVIPGMQKNKVSIYNRWGSKVFEKENYNNTTAVFKGLSDNGDELPSGTYFYKIAFEKLESRTGYLAIKR
jgi:gliding motility-associated-like protein